MTCDAPPLAANMLRMPVPQPTSSTVAPFISSGFCSKACRYASVLAWQRQPHRLSVVDSYIDRCVASRPRYALHQQQGSKGCS